MRPKRAHASGVARGMARLLRPNRSPADPNPGPSRFSRRSRDSGSSPISGTGAGRRSGGGLHQRGDLSGEKSWLANDHLGTAHSPHRNGGYHPGGLGIPETWRSGYGKAQVVQNFFPNSLDQAAHADLSSPPIRILSIGNGALVTRWFPTDSQADDA